MQSCGAKNVHNLKTTARSHSQLKPHFQKFHCQAQNVPQRMCQVRYIYTQEQTVRCDVALFLIGRTNT